MDGVWSLSILALGILVIPVETKVKRQDISQKTTSEILLGIRNFRISFSEDQDFLAIPFMVPSQ